MTEFHPLHTTLPRPQQLNNPLDYEPHPLCLLAADEVRAYLKQQTAWADEVANGKMFGVLVCEDEKGQLGFLAAYRLLQAGGGSHLGYQQAGRTNRVIGRTFYYYKRGDSYEGSSL